MRVLINCETSGVARRAFQAKGHEVYSCDILPADDGETKYHIQADAVSVANEPWRYPQISTQALGDWWDLMIAHPPCTYLCNSGVSWLYKHPRRPRWEKLGNAVEFFMALRDCGIPKIAIENPIPHRYAKFRSFLEQSSTFGIGQYTQIIQPYQFGHPERKATCLWLKGLPKLVPTDIVKLPMAKKKAQRLHYLPPSKDRWKIRSRTFEGIAKAMAEQWG